MEEGEAGKRIGGTYFTVNPMAVNENLDVFTENVRVVSVLDLDKGGEGEGKNEAFDRCVFVSIGALLGKKKKPHKALSCPNLPKMRKHANTVNDIIFFFSSIEKLK